MSLGGSNFSDVVDVFEFAASHESIRMDHEFKRHLQASLGHEIVSLKNKPYKKVLNIIFMLIFIVSTSILLAWGIHSLFIARQLNESDILPVNVDAPAVPIPDEPPSINFSFEPAL